MFSASAQATLLLADFRNESDLPDFSSAGPKVYENLGAVIGSGVELDTTHLVSNPANWGGGVVTSNFDPLTSLLTFASQDTWDFQTFLATVSNITFSTPGEKITGVSLVSNNLTTGGIVPIVSFTDDSLSILYTVSDIASGDSFDFTGGTAVFQITTSLSAIPEPGSTLAIAGLLSTGMLLRNRRACVKDTV